MTVKCKSCGTLNKDDAHFCRSCGTLLRLKRKNSTISILGLIFLLVTIATLMIIAVRYNAKQRELEKLKTATYACRDRAFFLFGSLYDELFPPLSFHGPCAYSIDGINLTIACYGGGGCSATIPLRAKNCHLLVTAEVLPESPDSAFSVAFWGELSSYELSSTADNGHPVVQKRTWTREEGVIVNQFLSLLKDNVDVPKGVSLDLEITVENASIYFYRNRHLVFKAEDEHLGEGSFRLGVGGNVQARFSNLCVVNMDGD